MDPENQSGSMLDRLLYTLTYLLFRWMGGLTPAARDRGAVALGAFTYALDRRHRRIAIQNLQRAFAGEKSPAEIRAIARRVFENLFRIVFEIGWSLRLPPGQFSRYFTIHGLDHYHRAMARGKGALILVAHFGNWELLPIVTRMAAMPARVVYRPVDAAFLDRFFKETRTRFGAVLIPNHIGAMQKIYRALRKGFPVGLLVDQNEGWRKGVYADFFGHRACGNPGMAMLALKSGAPVVPLFVIRKGDRFDVEFGPELNTIRTGDATRDIQENAQLYNDVVESYVRRFPDQWFWVHQRWKTPYLCPWPDPRRRARWLAGEKRRGNL